VERRGLTLLAGIAVRRAGEKDIRALRNLWAQYAEEIGRYRTAPWRWTWEDLAPRLRMAAAFLAETGGEPIGFAIASRSRPDIGHIEDLWVHPLRRRRGVATALVHHVAQALSERGVAHVALDVDADNDGARALYETLGFVHYADRLAADVARLEERLQGRLAR